MKKLSVLFLFISSLSFAFANESNIYNGVHQYLKNKTSNMQGKITIDVKKVSLEKFNFDSCKKIEIYTPQGNRLVGNVTVGIRCLDEDASKPNNVVLQAEIFQETKYLVASRKMNAGEELTQQDLKEEIGDVSRMYFKYYVSPEEVIGKKLKMPMIEGQIIRDTSLNLPTVIQYNQNVLVVDGSGSYKVTASGKSMNIAYEGQKIRVKMPNGKILQGTANADGTVSLIQK